MARLTDNDRRLGRFIVYGRSSWAPWSLTWSSGGGDDEGARNTLTVYAFGWVAQLLLPSVLRPYRVKHMALSWDAETVARLGRNWYYETFPRTYGFSLNDGFLQLFLGAQTHDSTTTQSWSCFLPWTQWRHVRRSLYDLSGAHFWTEPTGKAVPQDHHWEAQRQAREAVPKAVFGLLDYDGEQITATTHIEELEWRFGEGWFKWLSLFRRPKVRRSLHIEFDKETGPEKGSWKGGTMGTGIDMLPGELHEAAFRRYCGQEHRAKYRHYRVTFVGRAY